MNNSVETSISQPRPYRRGAIILFVLGLISIGSSNILIYLVDPALAMIEPISLVLIPVYIATGLFTLRQSLVAYRIGVLAFIVSGIMSLGISFLNSGMISAIIGWAGFVGITFLNVIYVLVIVALLVNTHKSMLNQAQKQ